MAAQDRNSKRKGASTAALERLTKWQLSWVDEYIGEREDLIAAGLIRADQFPGQPGIGKTRATFYDGKLCGKGPVGAPRDPRYLHVEWRGPTRFAVTVGISDDERARRVKEEEEKEERLREQREAQSEAQSEAVSVARAALLGNAETEDTGCLFKVGEAALFCDELVEIYGRFDVYHVTYGDEMRRRHGYLVRRPGGQPHFAAAWQLSEEDGTVRHVRLVESVGLSQTLQDTPSK